MASFKKLFAFALLATCAVSLVAAQGELSLS